MGVIKAPVCNYSLYTPPVLACVPVDCLFLESVSTVLPLDTQQSGSI